MVNSINNTSVKSNAPYMNKSNNRNAQIQTVKQTQSGDIVAINKKERKKEKWKKLLKSALIFLTATGVTLSAAAFFLGKGAKGVHKSFTQQMKDGWRKIAQPVEDVVDFFADIVFWEWLL